MRSSTSCVPIMNMSLDVHIHTYSLVKVHTLDVVVMWYYDSVEMWYKQFKMR